MYSRLCYGRMNVPFNYSEFVCDTEDDLKMLPTNIKGAINCSIGSKALVIESKKLYILNNQNEWKFLVDYNVSSGTGVGIDFATPEDIKSYLEI